VGNLAASHSPLCDRRCQCPLFNCNIFGEARKTINSATLLLLNTATGALVGILAVAMNVNFCLKTGWSQGSGILAVVISIGAFSIIGPAAKFTAKEANIAQTVASAAGQ
jgi:uncharacterized oligopeptide transporter (OPT) family protein